MSARVSAADLLFRIRHMRPRFRQFVTQCVTNSLSLNAGISRCCLVQFPTRCVGNPGTSVWHSHNQTQSAGSGTHER